MLKLMVCVIISWSLISSCGFSPAYLVATRITQDKTELIRFFPELTEREDILQIAEETGKSLGYQSKGMYSTRYSEGLILKVYSDKLMKQIVLPGGTVIQVNLRRPTPTGLALFNKKSFAERIGEERLQKITTFYIEMEHMGYWGVGGREEAEKIFNEFIDKFLEQAGVKKNS
jgi:hypothetical protein